MIKKFLTVILLTLSLSVKSQTAKTYNSELLEVCDTNHNCNPHHGIYDLQLYIRNDSLILYGQQFGTNLRVYVSLDFLYSTQIAEPSEDILLTYGGRDIRSGRDIMAFFLMNKDSYIKSIGVGDINNLLKFTIDPPQTKL